MDNILKIATLVLVLVVLSSSIWTILTGSITYITIPSCLVICFLYSQIIKRKDDTIKKLEIDITRRDKKITDLSEDRSKLLKIVGHELKVMISSLTSTATQILSEKELDQCKKDLELVVHSSRSLSQYIDDLIDYGSVKAKDIDFDERSFDIRRVIEDAYDLLKYEAIEYDIDLKIEIIEDSVPMPKYFIGDPNRVRQIYAGLGTRAIQCNKGGEVILRAEALKKHEKDMYKLYIQVADSSGENHSPISMNKSASLTISGNSRLDKSKINMNNGLGLNLLIAQKLCEGMGGEMLSDVDEEGVYHVFYGHISIKSTDRRFLYDNKYASKKDMVRNYGRKILIVEDNITNAKIIKDVITSLGCTSRLTSNGEEALGMLASGEHNFDMILMDIHMPVMDGIQTTEHIRLGDTIPIIAVSASGAIKKKAKEKGMNGFILKPISKGTIIDELDKWFHDSA